MPAGAFSKAFGEHEVNYRLMKGEQEGIIAKRREEEKNLLKNHQGSLKFKPKKALTGINSSDIGQLAISVDVANQNGGGILTNRYADEVQ